MTEESNTRPVAVVAGIGPGNGLALAQRFSDAGYTVALLGRDLVKAEGFAKQVPSSRAYSCDVGDAKSVSAAFSRIRSELGEVDALLFNAGSGVFADIETITAEQFEAAWRVNALGSFLCSKEVIPSMVARERGTIVFIGATASRRGGAQTAAFAPAKAAQRSLAESMARKLWPKGIHVALAIIDGVVDLPETRKHMPERPADAFVSPSAVAEAVHALSIQDRRGWSFEIEVRPFLETW